MHNNGSKRVRESKVQRDTTFLTLFTSPSPACITYRNRRLSKPLSGVLKVLLIANAFFFGAGTLLVAYRTQRSVHVHVF